MVVERGDFIKTLVFTGELKAVESTQIGPPTISSQWNFTIAYMIPEGTQVQPGDTLVRFDSSDLEPRRLDHENRRAEARIQIAQKNADIAISREDLVQALASAEKNFNVARLYADLDPQLVSRQQADEYQYNLEQAVLELEKAKERLANFGESSAADLRVAQLDFDKADLDLKRVLAELDKMTVRATSAGLAVYELGDEGRKLQVGDSVYRNDDVILLPNMEQLKVVITVFDTDFSALEIGAAAEIILDAFPERSFAGKLIRLPEVAKPKHRRSELNIFSAEVLLLELDLKLMKPGMTARVRVPVKREGVLIVPRTAIHLSEQGRSYVVPTGLEQTQIPVQLIDSNQDQVVVEGDLEEGQALMLKDRITAVTTSARDDWLTVQREDLRFTVSGSGMLRSGEAVVIRPPTIPRTHRFKIVELIPEGTEVQEGDLLVRFDDTELSRRLREEQSNLEKVEQQLERTRSSLELKERDLDLDLEDAKVQLEKATNKLGQARQFESILTVREAEFEETLASSRLRSLESKLKHTRESSRLQLKVLTDKQVLHQERISITESSIERLTMRATSPGVAIYASNWNNEKQQVGSEVHGMTPVMSLPNLGTIRIEGQVAEVDAGKLKLGQEVLIDIDAIPEQTFRGKVAHISSIFKPASFDRPIKVLELVVELDELDLRRMRPSMVTRLQIVLDSFQNALAIPLSVITIDKGESYVWINQDGRPARREIRVGDDNGVVAVVESGLSEGDQILKRPLAAEQ
jgi:HlyD family secretion protein